MEIAARFLATRPRTRWEIERRLRRAGASDEVIAGTLERLARMGYVDDAAFVRYWQEQRDRHAPRGRRLIEAELRQRGIGRDRLQAIDEDPEPRASDDLLPETEAERARIALERHLRGRPLPAERGALQRVGAFLIRRGFDPETVRGTLRDAGANELTES
jgi:regulatory protein